MTDAALALVLAAALGLGAAACSAGPSGDPAPTSASEGAGTPAPDAGATPSASPPPAPPAASGPTAGATALPPVGVGEEAVLSGGLVVTVLSVDVVDLAAEGPGEVAGPGVAVRVRLANTGDAPVDLAGTTVTATHGDDGTPAVPTAATPSAPAEGVLEPGADAEGTWAFRVPRGEESSLELLVSSTSSTDRAVVRS